MASCQARSKPHATRARGSSLLGTGEQSRVASGVRHLRSLLRRATSVPTTTVSALLAVRLRRLGDSGLGTQGNAEAEVEVPVRRAVPVPERRPTNRGHVEPTAATVHAVRALKVRPPSKVLSQNLETSKLPTPHWNHENSKWHDTSESQ